MGANTDSIAFYPTFGLNPFTGYGKVEAGLLQGLTCNGVSLNSLSDIILITGFPKFLTEPAFKNQRRWLYTMSESTRVSSKWVEILNHYAERVFVPCPMLINIYKESGVLCPIHAVGIGVDYAIPQLRVCKDTDPFTFLAYTEGWDQRKGVDLTIATFLELFGSDPHYKLLIKCRADHSWVNNFARHNIEIINGNLGESEWHDVLARTNCFLFPSRAEGWGMPPREATLAGIPAIVTHWLGMYDAEWWGIPIPIVGYEPSDYNEWEANARDSLWSVPDRMALKAKMSQVIDAYEIAQEKAMQGRDWLLHHYRWEQVVGRILQER